MNAVMTKFLADDLGFSAEQISALTPVEGVLDTAAERVNQFTQRQQQLERDRQAVATAQQEATAANERLNREMLEWAEQRASDQPITAKLTKRVEDAEAAAALANSRLRTVAERAGLNPDEVAPVAAVVTPTPTTTATPVDLTGYVKDTDVQARLGTMASYVLDMQPTLSRIQYEHGQLHQGAFLDTTAIINEIKTRAANKNNQKSLDPVAIWEELHGIPAKRTAAADKLRTDELTAAEQRGFERARTEQSIPGGQPIGQGSHSVVFKTNGVANAPKMVRPGAPTRIQAAASALASHRYRQPGTGGDQRRTA